MIVKSGLEFLFGNSASPFRVATAHCKNICPETVLKGLIGLAD
jgi:hypothetical protein